jgi:aminoglycoside/choline kinase family phosphotransferase
MTILHSDADVRLKELSAWLVKAAPSIRIDTLRPASSDASFRRYFRADTTDGQTRIIMDAPPPQENVRPFIEVAGVFANTGVTVPEILAQDVDAGFLVLSDLGTTTYLNLLSNDTAHKLYMDAIDALILLQTQSKPGILPNYDRAKLQQELQLFPDWYITKHLGVTLTEADQAVLTKTFDTLLANNLAQAPVFVHRDYHSRNLMVMQTGNPGILDFQDAVYGPLTYDLVSLLRDAYIQWDEEIVLDWAIRYWEKAKRAGLAVAPDVDSFYRDFEWMGLQRHLKILGIFARLYHRDGKEAYLSDIPLVLEYVLRTARRYTAFTPLVRLIERLEDKAPKFGYTF